MSRKKVIVIGAGPAGLTSAYELLSRSNDYEVVVLEKTDSIGGIARNVNHNGNIMDIGGHRFFTDIAEVEKWWKNMMPLMEQERVSRIYFNHKFFDYPVKLKIDTVKNMGIGTTLVVCGSFLKSKIARRKVVTLEDYYIRQFGKKMYQMFFEKYTENLWGKHPRDISPEYGMQRVNDNISVSGLLKDMILNNRKKENEKKDTFLYPKYGPGQMWECVAHKIEEMGGKIVFGADVVELERGNDCVTGVVCKRKGRKITYSSDYVISSMPLKDLVVSLDNVPKKYVKIANGLPYRDYKIVGVLVKKLKLDNIVDDWIYIHDKSVKMGRVQVYNNWSPYLVKKPKNNVWLGLEYFCNKDDELWNMSDEAFVEMATKELVKLGLINGVSDVIDCHVERQEKAYPAYFGAYDRIGELKDYLGGIKNLYLVGRNGRHEYSNMDYSMLTAFEAVKSIIT